jgi:hypothetical protein
MQNTEKLSAVERLAEQESQRTSWPMVFMINQGRGA